MPGVTDAIFIGAILGVKRAKRIAVVIDLLRDAQVIADSMKLLNSSGGEIACLIGTIADELEEDIKKCKA